MRVFLDTNVLAAGFATRGLCSDLVREVLENHELTCSDGILVELERILTKRFKVSKSQTQEVLNFLRSIALIAKPDEHASYPISDLDDISHLSAAEVAQCEVFVTGDKELWLVRTEGKLRVISPRAFWKLISAQSGSRD